MSSPGQRALWEPRPRFLSGSSLQRCHRSWPGLPNTSVAKVFGFGRGCFGREGVQSCTGSFPDRSRAAMMALPVEPRGDSADPGRGWCSSGRSPEAWAERTKLANNCLQARRSCHCKGAGFDLADDRPALTWRSGHDPRLVAWAGPDRQGALDGTADLRCQAGTELQLVETDSRAFTTLA